MPSFTIDSSHTRATSEAAQDKWTLYSSAADGNLKTQITSQITNDEAGQSESSDRAAPTDTSTLGVASSRSELDYGTPLPHSNSVDAIGQPAYTSVGMEFGQYNESHTLPTNNHKLGSPSQRHNAPVPPFVSSSSLVDNFTGIAAYPRTYCQSLTADTRMNFQKSSVLNGTIVDGIDSGQLLDINDESHDLSSLGVLESVISGNTGVETSTLSLPQAMSVPSDFERLHNMKKPIHVQKPMEFQKFLGGSLPPSHLTKSHSSLQLAPRMLEFPQTRGEESMVPICSPRDATKIHSGLDSGYGSSDLEAGPSISIDMGFDEAALAG